MISIPNALIPFLDPEGIITGAGPWALLVVCLIVFAETGLLVGFLLPGDTLLLITGLFAFHPGIGFDIWWVCLAIGLAAFLGGEAGYLIGRKAGPAIFERKESGVFSVKNVQRTNSFFERYGGLAVIVARFVPIVRTFAPVAAGVGKMDPRKYTLYNFIGAVIWGVGLTFLGYLLGYIPIVSDFVKEYIDVILIGAVIITLIPTIYHYIKASREAKRERLSGETASVAAEELVLDRSLFDQDKSNDPKH